ncbi:hypothetical protein NDU88_002763 [Pleurodeles waltl]|uniref:Uncharacterized protein n=1 Tax=Pleurodeles waltl TaxID=8319 RepID=A0AAV7W3C1_PLEWA|nr:hypothetical protein NDU88_002763 [Pleurodeles waltl]
MSAGCIPHRGGAPGFLSPPLLPREREHLGTTMPGRRPCGGVFGFSAVHSRAVAGQLGLPGTHSVPFSSMDWEPKVSTTVRGAAPTSPTGRGSKERGAKRWPVPASLEAPDCTRHVPLKAEAGALKAVMLTRDKLGQLPEEAMLH